MSGVKRKSAELEAAEAQVAASMNEVLGTWTCNQCRRRLPLGKRCSRVVCYGAGHVGLFWVDGCTNPANRVVDDTDVPR